MKKLILVLTLMLWTQLVTVASAACAGKESTESAFGRSTFVFSGRVLWLDQVIARIQVDKVWKGEERSEIVMRTGTMLTETGFMMISERLNYSVGQQYIVYASGPLDQLIAPACSRSDLLSDQEVAALDAVTPHRKIGTDIHRCTAPTGSGSAELQMIVSTSSEVPQRGVKVTLDGPAKHDGAQSGDGGRVSFTGLQPGEYKLTADLPGYAPKQTTVTVTEKACMEAALFLSPSK